MPLCGEHKKSDGDCWDSFNVPEGCSGSSFDGWIVFTAA